MKTTLPPDLEAKLAHFRRRVWIVKLAEGVLAALFGLTVSYLLVFVLDRFGETPVWARVCILVAGGATLGLGLPLKWHRWVWRQRRLEDVARLLRLTFPRLGDQLLGIVELARMDHGAAGRSERLVQAAIAQTAEAVKERDFTKAVPNAHHRQWGLAAAFVVGLAALAFVVVSPAAQNALIRWIAPWRHTERFTFAEVEPLPASMVVPYAEPFNLPVRLSTQTQWSPSVGSGRIGDQPQVEAKLASGIYSFVIPPQKQDATLLLSLGDARKSILIEPRTRPELSEIKVHVRLPDYLGYKSEQTTEVRDGSVGILKGAQAAFEAKAIREIASATLDGQPQKVDDGKIVTEYETVTADVDRQFNWTDHDGLTPHDPLVLKVKAAEDEAPTVVARRESLEEVVLDSEVVTFDLTATDDFGVKEVGLEWTGSLMQDDGKTPIHGEKVASAGEPEKKELKAPATFCATREGVAPQTLEIRAWVTDYLPGRQRVHSAAFILHILNKTDHALWLTEQFGKWLEVAKESYEREQQLNATNKELRALSPADLDRPENRRKVALQAAAENANASRLDSLTQSGKSLVEQATKNDEFDAQRLESWATMLKTLQDIAANRMPNVSDLLKQTASAPAGNPGATNPGSPNPGAPPPQPQKPTTPSPPNGKTVAGVSQGGTLPNGTVPPPIDPNAPPKPPMPSISDREPGFDKGTDPKPPDPNAPPTAPGGGKLRLPSTTLAAAPDKNPKPDDPSPPQSPAQQTMQTAVTQQNDLLTEFAKVSDQLSQILTSLEASTFVKRFKAASREQMKVASTIDQKTLDAFGIENAPLPAAEPIAKQAKDQSEVVGVIQSDLDAYFQRKQDARFKTTLDEMKKSEIVRALSGDGDKVSVNLSGQAMTGSEYWADTLDRWAEEMVAASHCKASSSCSGDSLPPEIVLKVMQSLRDEMKLRDETRETENAKPAVAVEKFTADAKTLASTQTDITTHTTSALTDILALPDGENKFGKEIGLLKNVVAVMDETHGILDTPDTGPNAVGAESEAIELLLQSKRSGSKGGGGGGANPGIGGTANSASQSALADLGPGSDATGTVAARPVGQDTGVAGKEFPDEYKPGLDAYFSLLEKQSAGK
jgi:hypothetical protein